MLHNVEVVVHYEVMNSNVPCMCIQADWYRPCNTNQRTTGVLFSWHDLERKMYCWNWVVYFDCIKAYALDPVQTERSKVAI